MKKISFSCTLNHKAGGYEPLRIVVEKVIELYGKRFEKIRDHPSERFPEIVGNKELMFTEGETAHCILFLDANSNDGILVESEGADYALKSQYVPDARALIEQNEITNAERNLHKELKDIAERIAELSHAGDKYFCFADLADDVIVKSLLVSAVGEMLIRREDMESVNVSQLDVEGQPEFTVVAKPTHEIMLTSPLSIRASMDNYDTEDNEFLDEELYELSPYEALTIKDDVNEEIRGYCEPEEEHRGLMVYYSDNPSISEKVFSAFPCVEERKGKLVGVLKCKVADELSELEIKELVEWWTGQCSDGWGEGFEQRVISTSEYGDVYVSIWNSSDDWSVDVEAIVDEELSEDEEMTMGGM